MSIEAIRALKSAAGKKEPKKRKWMKPRTKKKAKEYRELGKIVGPFLEEHPYCEIRSPDCTHLATCVHHVKGRAEDVVLDPEYHKACCSPCNHYVENHHAWAVENGHKVSRHAKSDQ